MVTTQGSGCGAVVRKISAREGVGLKNNENMLI